MVFKGVPLCTSYVIHSDVVFEGCRNMLKFFDLCCERSTKSVPDMSPTDLAKADRITKERCEPYQFLGFVSDVVECLAVESYPRQVWYRRTLVVGVTNTMLTDDRTAGH